MWNTRRLVCLFGLLSVIAWVSLSHGQSARPAVTPKDVASAPVVATSKAEGAESESRFARGSVLTYRPRKDEQLFAMALKPPLPASAVKGRDYLIMISLSATQAGEGWVASTRIAESMIELAGPNDRLCIWTIGTPSVTKNVTGDFLSPRDERELKKLKSAIDTIKLGFPAGDTDLKEGLTKAVESFDGPANHQRILFFLGDGQSTHNPMSADDRADTARNMVARRIAFFPAPLGVHVHPENLHGLANSTGGVVLRTRVGEELLVDCMKRYVEAFQGNILYDAEAQMPACVQTVYPTRLPPLRSDSPTLIAGSMTSVEGGDFPVRLTGTPVGSSTRLDIPIVEKIQAPEADHYFLANLVTQWKSAKDRPALLRADRTLGLAYEQTKLHREELMIAGELAIKDLKLDDAARAFHGVKVLAPHDPEPDAGLRVVAKIKAGQLSPDAMKKVFENRKGSKLEKGQWKAGVAVAALQDEPAEKPRVVPAPGGQDRQDFLQQNRDQRIVIEQKWTELVDNAVRAARREITIDPDGTLDTLRTMLSRVLEHPELSDRVRTGLATRLSTSLREAKSVATVLSARKEEIARNVTTAKILIERQVQAKTFRERQEEQIRNFRSQIEIAYFDEKTKVDLLNNLVAMQTESRLRGEPMPLSGQATYEMVLAGYNLEKSKELRKLREDRYLATMVALDRSNIPFPDEPGIEFPKLATWKVITEQRKGKYDVSTVPDDPRGRKAADSLLKLLDDEIEIPDEFKQPVSLRLILKFFGDRLSARGRDLPIWIDQNAFKEDAAEAPELLDANVTFPAFIRKMPIATALRVALSQLPGNNATYLIRRDYIEVTTNDRAMMEKVMHVHPVADLTIPISQQGGLQTFGTPSQISTGGFGGGFNGGFGGGFNGGFGGGFGGGGLLGGGIGGGLGGFGGGGFAGMSFQPGSGLGGVSGTFNGGSFQGGFNGSLGALGGGPNMNELIKLITITIDPGHWYYVQQQGAFQQTVQGAINPLAPFLGNQLANAGGGVLGGAGGGNPAAGGPPTPPSEGGPASLLDPRTNTIYPYMPTLALIVRAQARTHTSLTGGIIGGKSKLDAGAAMAANDPKNANRGVVPIGQVPPKAQIAGVADKIDPKNPKNNPVTNLVVNDAANKVAGKPLTAPDVNPAYWDHLLSQGNIAPNVIIATAETLFEQADKKNAVEFLKANLRQGIVVRPWVFEALAIALEATGGNPAEIRRARLSAVALDPTDADGFLEAARAMVETGQYDRGLAFCRQAALIEPNLVHAYDQALVYAEQAKDAKAMEWAASRLVSQDWPLDNGLIHLKAQTRVNALAQSLDRTSNKSDSDKLRNALQTLKQRDLVVHLTWETTHEPAEMELIVAEPNGTVCSFEQRQTAGGGTLLTNDPKSPNRLSYIAAHGFSGPYVIKVRKLWGRPLFSQARLEIIENYAGPNETRHLQIVKIDEPRTYAINLNDGRRNEFVVVSPANLKRRAEAPPEKTVNGYELLRRMVYPETFRAEVNGPGSSSKLPDSVTPARTSPVSTVRVGVQPEGRPTGEPRNLNLMMQPVYQNLKSGRPTGNLSVIPGSR